jgi:amidohydrolase
VLLADSSLPALDPVVSAAVTASSATLDAELRRFRRDLHAHPELAWAEHRTTEAVRARLAAAGLAPTLLPGGTGLVCDVGTGVTAVALRADLDALPVQDEKAVEYRSTVPGHCHACGHDVHAAVVLGAGLVLAELDQAGRLPGRVRLVFQPAEEATPGGALAVLAAGSLEAVTSIYAVHCDPSAEVGTVGLRVGPITGSADHVRVRLTGAGGHTARPHLTGDLVYALAKVVTETPAVLSRRADPRHGLSLVWGQVHAGAAPNTIPRLGYAEGTVRALSAAAWELAPRLVEDALRSVVAPYGLDIDVQYDRGVPPVVNDDGCVRALAGSAASLLGPSAVVDTEQSLGGEDFAWYLGQVPGALARLGVRRLGDGTPQAPHDLHQGTFDVDEAAIGVGVRLLVGAGLLGLIG